MRADACGERRPCRDIPRGGSTGFVQVLDSGTGKLLATVDTPSHVTECGLASAGGRLYVCCEDGTLGCLE